MTFTSSETSADLRDAQAKAIIDSLIELARTSDIKSSSRAALAELRRAVADPLRAAPYVAPYLGEPRYDGKPERLEKWSYIVAGLFAIHRKHSRGVSLGSAFKQINAKSGSIEPRFLQLLTTDERRLEDLLRHAIRLLAANDVAIDWYRLLDDILWWNSDDKRRQHQLARDFYREDKGLGDNNSETEETK